MPAQWRALPHIFPHPFPFPRALFSLARLYFAATFTPSIALRTPQSQGLPQHPYTPSEPLASVISLEQDLPISIRAIFEAQIRSTSSLAFCNHSHSHLHQLYVPCNLSLAPPPPHPSICTCYLHLLIIALRSKRPNRTNVKESSSSGSTTITKTSLSPPSPH